VLNADTTALAADQQVANLKMNRRDQQIALAAALGGGYTDNASNSTSEAASAASASAAQTNPVVAAR
jgi:outer membrane protein TolC